MDSSREYHLSIRVSDSLIERLHPEIVAEVGEKFYRKQLGESGFSLMQDLFQTGVVGEMYMMTHSISIYRETPVPWNEVNKAVLSVLKTRFPNPHEVVILKLPRKQVLPEHYHPEDSDQPGFQMPA